MFSDEEDNECGGDEPEEFLNHPETRSPPKKRTKTGSHPSRSFAPSAPGNSSERQKKVRTRHRGEHEDTGLPIVVTAPSL